MIAALLALTMTGPLQGLTIAEMRHTRRVLIVAAPSAQDPQRRAQEWALHDAGTTLAERDVTVVEVTGDNIVGARDEAAAARRHWKLPTGQFAVLLIGKDGHEALRRHQPIDTTTLIATIDAMPMRRAGLR